MFDAEADEVVYFVAGGFYHFADLAVAAFFEDYAEAALAFAGDLGREGADAVHDHAVFELVDEFLVDAFGEGDAVLFFVLKFWIEETVGDAAVVGHDEESVRVLVETADREDGVTEFDHVEDVFFVALGACRDDADGLVVGVVYESLFVAFELYLVVYRVDLHAVDGLLTVYEYFACFDELVGLTARAEALVGHVFVDTDSRFEARFDRVACGELFFGWSLCSHCFLY